MNYTLEVSEKRDTSHKFYVDSDLKVRPGKADCKPLSKEDAKMAARIVRRQAIKLSRPVSVRIVELEG